MLKSSLYIGLMSGTSADGVDAALMRIQPNSRFELLDFISPSLPSTLKHSLLTLNDTPTLTLEHFCQLSFDIAAQFSQTTHTLLKKNGLKPGDIQAIGSHGQTIYHAPQIPMSLQIGHPALIAKTTGIQTVADFRVDDMALGGQGAPFAPAFHQQLFASEQACFVVNIGGIANISYLQPNAAPLGYDTGPGNALMDEICHAYFDKPFDEKGDLARQGSVNTAFLSQLLTHPYFSKSSPKSTGRETFNIDWLNAQAARYEQLSSTTLSKQELLSTLCELTAYSIAQQVQITQQSQPLTDAVKPATIENTTVWIVGGGAYNQYLIERIQHHLPNHSVQSSERKQINPNAIEAMMCAWLAEQRIAQKSVPLAAVTGAKRDAILGGVWLP